MLQNTTPHAAESNLNPNLSDELEILGRVYFDTLLRAPALRSVSLSGLFEWGEATQPNDHRMFLPMPFEGEIVGSIELRFDPESDKEEIFKVKQRIEREAIPQLAPFLAWKEATLKNRLKTITLLWELKKKYSDFDWIGIYRLQPKTTDLVVGSYIGEATEHVRIPIEHGICGAAIRENDTVNVPDVLSDPRFIACSVKTRSELVVPIRNSLGEAFAEIDIDSNRLAAFTPEKVAAVQAVAFKLAPILGN